MYGLPSAENWLGARSGLKLFYHLAANNTLEAHVGSPAGYTFKFVTQSVREIFAVIFLSNYGYRDVVDRYKWTWAIADSR